MTEADPPSLLTFPCDFPIKIMAHAREDMELTLVIIVRRHVPDLGEAAVTTRLSKGGKYIAVTATFQAQSRVQLDALYQELSTHKFVVMVL